MTLLETRKEYKLSQADAAAISDVPLRTYIRYEKDEKYGNALKRDSMIQKMLCKCEITEEKGLLTIEKIKEKVNKLFESEYKDKVLFCYLFGSYAKGHATEKSDIDLCVSTSLKGLDFVGLVETLRETLHKKVDVIRFNSMGDNVELLSEIMKDGIKIYG